jgi:2-beta-glucuronyltransferase
MKIVLISGHDGASDRKTGFHFWAEILSRRGHDVDFLTVGSSWISLIRKNGKQLKPPFNRWVSLGGRVRKYTWMPPFHPLYLGNRLLDILSTPVFALYPWLMPPALLKSLRKADVFIIENGAGQMLVPRLSKLNPRARIIFNSCDRPSVLNFHPLIVRSEKTMLPYVDAIRLNAALMAEDFPTGTETHYIPQAIDKGLFDAPMQNPYQTAKNAINVGDMIFDAKAVEILATNFPEWTFHLFGKGAKIGSAMPNVIEHGEVPFAKLVPYLKYADIGLSPYKNSPKAAYLGQSSLKNVQYTYCRLPIVAPRIASGSRPHIIAYNSSDDTQSVIHAFEQAIAFDRSTIDINVVPSWEDVIDRMLALAEDGRAKKIKA